MLGRKKRDDDTRPPVQVLKCSFCNKSQDDVQKLIAGPAVFICDECLEVCNAIVAEDNRLTMPDVQRDVDAPHPLPTTPLAPPIVTCRLCSMPLPYIDALVVENRGFLCPGCVDAVQAAAAERRETDGK